MRAIWRLAPTSTPRIFTIQRREEPNFQFVNRATLALDPEMNPSRIERWRRFVEEALNEKAERDIQ